MPQLFLPPRVARELLDRSIWFRSAVLQSIEPELPPGMHDLALAILRANPRVMLVRARSAVVPGIPMKPGYYHLLEDSGSETSAPISVTTIEGPHGEFVEPTSRVLDKLAAGDPRERRNWERWAAHERAEKRANDREQANLREERRDHLRDLVNAYTRTSVSTTKATPWRQNQNGHRRGGGK